MGYDTWLQSDKEFERFHGLDEFYKEKGVVQRWIEENGMEEYEEEIIDLYDLIAHEYKMKIKKLKTRIKELKEDREGYRKERNEFAKKLEVINKRLEDIKYGDHNE